MLHFETLEGLYICLYRYITMLLLWCCCCYKNEFCDVCVVIKHEFYDVCVIGTMWLLRQVVSYCMCQLQVRTCEWPRHQVQLWMFVDGMKIGWSQNMPYLHTRYHVRTGPRSCHHCKTKMSSRLYRCAESMTMYFATFGKASVCHN